MLGHGAWFCWPITDLYVRLTIPYISNTRYYIREHVSLASPAGLIDGKMRWIHFQFLYICLLLSEHKLVSCFEQCFEIVKVRYFRIENGFISFCHQSTPPATLVVCLVIYVFYLFCFELRICRKTFIIVYSIACTEFCIGGVRSSHYLFHCSFTQNEWLIANIAFSYSLCV